jgi:hypothetical protein
MPESPLALSLTSTSTGVVFLSTFSDIEARELPTAPLPSSHPFHAFWKEHIAALTQPGLYDTVIDALIALVQDDISWRRKSGTALIFTKRHQIRDLLNQHPPDVVVVSGVADVYGFHFREQDFWPFIHISEEYINLWMDTGDKSSERALALTALLGTTIDHELGHWVFTLVSNTVI